ncbi:DHA2 family efflux MFS transporter permease subunit [Nocardioides oleivorans]|uniref:DHA2 family efflux MFS transporter permease subunit n=1 Tax=Nocardioides oleivorans TaxID=273676 RepID=A0A4Q2RZD4_9ACTN|nr:DHA2 family efflux MFS transporter permease subunit [Nocardioides oleivorans]RYB94498.1 DHA2 family efflux MFS transporter permease subunit [Nocardioides oleivorans]
MSTGSVTHTDTEAPAETSPWPALVALCIGFFMILVDTTIVTVATPAIIEDLQAGVNEVVWVTSAYLLAYAVPVLITGRLGDRFGPKNLYLVGLTVFTLASLACGLTSTIEGLIAARVAQGLGASMMTPQTMAVITRIFPIERRGSAMALWGATAGVATLVGPIAGGVLVDTLGWEWIFFVNVPVGIIAFALAWRLVPRLDTNDHRFDWLGVVLSGAGMFLLVFGIQEGEQYDWSTITGPITVWRLIVAGLVVMGVFVWWQARNKREPLVPLSLFGDRNFSVSNLAITTVSFTFTAMGFPLMLWAQLVRGYSPTESGLLLAPMAVTSIVFAPIAGRLTDRLHPRLLTLGGFAGLGVSLLIIVAVLDPDTPLWQLLGAFALMGIGSSFLWGPLATTANRNLAPQRAGAGSGVYNATRQVGAVLGSAAIAVLIDARLAANGLTFSPSEGSASGGALPAQVAGPFTDAMAQSLLLLPVVLALGLVAVMFFERPRHFAARSADPAPVASASR